MLRRLTVRNFQAHEKRSIEFDRYVTTLVGRTDSGKSALIRAMLWLCTNKPSGEAFLRHGEKTVWAKLELDNGRTITRRRGPKNLYKLDGKKLVAFGADVPEPVADLLNVGSTNFQQQLDGPFWLSDSPGQVSRALNKIINLDVIDRSLANIAATIRKKSTEKNLIRDRLRAAKDAAEKLQWVRKFDRDLHHLEKLEKELSAKRARIDSLASAIQTLENARLAARGVSGAISVGRGAVEIGTRWQKQSERIENLRNLLQKIENAKELACRSREKAEAAARSLEKKFGDRCPMCGKER